MTYSMSGQAFPGDERKAPAGLFSHLIPSVAVYAVILIVAILGFYLPTTTDYIGPDNDDVMRLVEVRDFLNGQGWFDLTQYRLGLEGGTLMHWSRLVDLPIASLILLFSLFTDSRAQAEALAAMVWPLGLAVGFLFSLGLACRRLGGVATMHIGLGIGAIYLFTTLRFYPGALDHHNIQLTVLMFIAAMLVDRRMGGMSHGFAGFSAAFAMAIGAETLPVVAMACVIVALQWAWHGKQFERAARSFGLALTLGISFFFLATVPPSHYGTVTCDNLSLGFYALAAIGGTGLFLAARFGSALDLRLRIASLAGLGLIVGLAALLIAPQCLGNPLGDLDPLLVSLWLNAVVEAQPALSQLRVAPDTFGGFYAVGFFAIMVCIFRIQDRERVETHLVLLALVATAWAISLIQVRGAFISNALAILPLSLIITDLKRNSNAEPENMNAGFAYIITVLCAVPVVWVFFGAVSTKGIGNALTLRALTNATATASDTGSSCRDVADMRVLAAIPPVVVAAPSDSGAQILRYTPHRVLTAPYHRNQSGMLTELHIGLAQPKEAEAFLRGAKVSVLAFCPNDVQTMNLAQMKPDGLYAQLEKGNVPAFLQPLPAVEGQRFQLYRVIP
ncbi:hypothetical protein ACFSE1_04185 [Rhizobium helianthi]|uniref:GtrA family protein n=1 Tax=Rhizobium helianthi TaxID=1132695 RepID=A0ABW4LZM5_9HYPH